MKKIIQLLILSVSSTSCTIKDQLVRYAPHAVFAHRPLKGLYTSLTAEKIVSEHFIQITDEKIVSFCTKECQKITPKPIRFFVGDGAHIVAGSGHIAFACNSDLIIIHQDYYDILTTIFTKDVMTDQDSAALNIFKFILQHEAGHIKNNDSNKRVAYSFVTAGIKMCVFEYMRNYFKSAKASLAAFLVLNLTEGIFSGLYNRHQEQRADNGVATKEALKGGIQLFTNIIAIEENNPALKISSRIASLASGHPAPQERLQSAQEKLNNL